jgi:hypothetical protein
MYIYMYLGYVECNTGIDDCENVTDVTNAQCSTYLVYTCPDQKTKQIMLMTVNNTTHIDKICRI